MPFITITYPPKYPLTESEKKWLEKREKWNSKSGYYLTPGVFPNKTLYRVTEYADYRDAAEFEARVVKEALHVTIGDLPCADGPDCKAPHFDKYSTEEEPVGCAMCTLCAVRLAIEQEMEQ